MLITKGNIKYNVTKGAYEAIYKPLDYKPVLDKSSKVNLDDKKDVDKEKDKSNKDKPNNFNNEGEN